MHTVGCAVCPNGGARERDVTHPCKDKSTKTSPQVNRNILTGVHQDIV